MQRNGDVDPRDLSREELQEMAEAGVMIRECYRVLAKTDDNVVGELLKRQGTFYEWNHYPDGDVYDHETHAQYYYHAHPAEERSGEHGHFHTFLRPKGMPANARPAPVPDYIPPENPDDALSHIVAISMDRKGLPIKLFTTNRWVTGEVWYRAEDVCRFLHLFAIDHAQPSWPVNIWISKMLVLFRPQVKWLLRRRDAVVAQWQEAHPGVNVFEDRSLEVTAEMAIDVDRQIAEVAKVSGMRRTGSSTRR